MAMGRKMARASDNNYNHNNSDNCDNKDNHYDISVEDDNKLWQRWQQAQR